MSFVVTFTVLYICICSFLNVDIQVLQIQMCQKLQEEAKPKKNKMDQSIQKGIRKGTDSGEIMDYKSAFAEIYFLDIAHLRTCYLLGQLIWIWETPKCTC